LILSNSPHDFHGLFINIHSLGKIFRIINIQVNMDKLKQAALDWWDSILAIIGAFLAADSIISPMQNYGFINNEQVRVLGVVLFLVFGVTAILRARVSLNRYKNTLPEIVVSKPPTWEIKNFASYEKKPALYIEFKNIASHPSENSAALHVSATVRWKDIKGNLVTENHGRWHITNRQSGLGHAMQTVDIYPNDQEVMLHFGIKSPEDRKLVTAHHFFRKRVLRQA
jgi:hypothetical protein